jgi:hypothetical protein
MLGYSNGPCGLSPCPLRSSVTMRRLWCTASASAAHQLRKLRFWPSRPWRTTTGRRSLPWLGARLTISADVRMCGVVIGVVVVVVGGSVEVMALAACSSAMTL